MMKTPLPAEIVRRCREMRRAGTPAEAVLGGFLRNRGMRSMKFRWQHPVKGYILDFYCQEAKLAIELDGGGHAQESQMRYDQERRVALAVEGIRVLRFGNHEVMNQLEYVLAEIWQALVPHPDHTCPFGHPKRVWVR